MTYQKDEGPMHYQTEKELIAKIERLKKENARMREEYEQLVGQTAKKREEQEKALRKAEQWKHSLKNRTAKKLDSLCIQKIKIENLYKTVMLYNSDDNDNQRAMITA